MYPSVREISSTVPYHAARDVWVNDNDQNVGEIITAIEKRHKLDYRDYNSFSDKFWAGNVKDTGQLLFDFCKKHITYIIESENDQTVKTPGRIFADKYGDCKHYALFIVGVCDSLNRKGYPIKGKFRFVSDFPQREVHHVFAVIEGKDKKDFWVDPVINYFNERPTFYNTKDVDMSISSLSGTFNQDIAQVGRHKWEAFVNPFRGTEEIINFIRSHGKQPHDFKDKNELAHFIIMHHPSGHAYLRRNAGLQLPGSDNTAMRQNMSGVGKKKAGHNNFLKKIAEGAKTNANNLKKGVVKDLNQIKTLSLKVTLAAGRGPFLSIVDINGFNLAHRLHDTLMGPKKQDLLNKWQSLGGNPKMLINAVNNGYRQYKIHHGGYNLVNDKIHGTSMNISGVGVVQVAALLALASGIIAALGKYINSSAEEKKQMAGAAKEGVHKIAAGAVLEGEAIAEGKEPVAMKDHNQPTIKATTGVDDQGNPEIQVSDVAHAMVKNAGYQGPAVADGDQGAGDIIPGGGAVPVPQAKQGFDVGGNVDQFVNGIKSFIVQHRNPIIWISIGTLAVTMGPGIVRKLGGKKKGRR